MNKKIYFDHTYTGDQNHKFWKKLGKLGFILHTKKAEHPDAVCQFIMFEKPGYLEFAHCLDRSSIDTRPGFSFGIENDLKTFFNKLRRKNINCSFSHRNYNWKENSEDDLPGWNFLNFKNTGIRTFYPWITEYQSSPAGKVKVKNSFSHPNGVTHVIGHEFVINNAGEKFFGQILGTKIKDQITLSCGRVLYFKRGRTCYHSKVILKSKNMENTKLYIPNMKGIIFDDKEVLLISNPSPYKRMWDIIITT